MYTIKSLKTSGASGKANADSLEAPQCHPRSWLQTDPTATILDTITAGEEPNRLNPSTVAATTELGPWTRASSQWMALSTDRTTSFGLGVAYDFGKVRFTADYSLSDGTVDIGYSGFGAVSSVNPANPLLDDRHRAGALWKSGESKGPRDPMPQPQRRNPGRGSQCSPAPTNESGRGPIPDDVLQIRARGPNRSQKPWRPPFIGRLVQREHAQVFEHALLRLCRK